MSKAALDHFTKTMAHSLQAEGVRVNSINPATVRKSFQVFFLFSIIISVKNLITKLKKSKFSRISGAHYFLSLRRVEKSRHSKKINQIRCLFLFESIK